MVHSAYDSFQLLKSCPSKIECAGSWNSKLLLGCIDGSLRIYAPESTLKQQQQQPSSSPDQTLEIKKEPYVLEKTVVGFSKKPLVSMEVLGSRKLLLSLSEWIAFHRLPDLEAFAMISKTKGANVYGWDDRRGFLCVAKQKKVILYRYDGGREFVEVKEFNVPDMVKAMSWCGENICLGIRREYMIMNGTTGALSEVFPCGRIAAPLVVPLPSGELLLGKDNIGVFVDQNGKLLQEGRICWSEPPGSVAIHMPYAVARLAKHIEIRSLRAPYPLVQTVTLRDIHFLVSSNNCLIAALDTCVYGLLPVPLGAQIVQLTASGDFEEALALCKLLPPEDSNLRAAKEGSIHIRYGHYLFDNRNYEEAMEQFLASSVDITHVLSLYPSIVLPKMAVSEPEKVLEFASDYTYLSRVSSDASDEMESSSPSNIEDQSDEKQMLEHKKMRHNALMALIKFLQRKRYVVIERATAERTEEVVFDAVQFDSHWPKGSSKNRGHMYISSGARETAAIMDTALLQALLLTGQHSSALELFKGPNYCDVKICEEFLRHRKLYVVLLELFKYNEMHHEALKLLDQLVEESNSNQTQSDLTQKFRPDMIVDYLKPLCATDPMLVLEFSMHVLESCPSQTIDLLLSGNISPDLVNSYLKQYAPHMQGTYLEHMLSMNEHGISNNLHNELVQIYLSEVLEWHGDLMAQQKWDEKEYTPTRKKLLSALENMSGYNPEALLKRLPADALYEERALLLGKMQQHQLALSLYVHKLHGPELALAYCDRIYELGQNQPSSKAYTNIYLTLLQIYLNPQKTTKEFEQHIVNLVATQGPGIQKSGLVKSKWGRGAKKIAEIKVAEDVRPILSSSDSGRSDGDGDEPSEGGPIMLDEALDLLSQRWDKINGAQALKLLPRETKFQNLLPFLEPLLKKSSEGLRNFSVIKSLRHSESLQVKEELYNHRRRVVKINSDSMCSLCNKRIGTSVFAVYPNGNTLVHFVCFRDSQNLKAVRGTPRVKRV